MWETVEGVLAQKNVVAILSNHKILCLSLFLCNTIQNFNFYFVDFDVEASGLIRGVTGFFLIIKTTFNIIDTTNIITATT